ncbi:MAG TPA: exodeoxyribonuclease VII small subunit, partial [Trebonia sp.]|nr:exodeoxyribonuclease VII small subunit [Trebonia sp.]
EQSLDLWERGEKLAAICAEWLEGARARLTAAMAARDGDGARDGDAEGDAVQAGRDSQPRRAAREDPGAPF